MKVIYLIRHTKVGIQKDCFYGHADVPLAGSFFGEATFTRAKLPKELDFPVWSSPLGRCRILGETFEVPYHTDDRLKELDFGEWELKKFQDIPDTERLHYLNNFVELAPPGGESYLDLMARSREFLFELVNQPQEHFAVITHAGVIRCLVCMSLNLPLHHAYRFQVDYGSVTTLLFGSQGFQLGRLNL